MGNAPHDITTVTSVIAEAADLLAEVDGARFADTEELNAKLIAAGARVESMTAVVTLAEAMLVPGACQDETLKRDLRNAIRMAKGLPSALDHYTSLAREAQQAAA